jgi:hypothetical protein
MTNPAPIAAAPTCHDQTQAPSTPIVLGLRPKDAARALGISERLLWSMTNRHEIPCCRIGKALVYPVDMLREFLAARSKIGRP